MEVIRSPPLHGSFTPLSAHQSQTPESFFSGPPVLHHHSPYTTLSLHKSDLDSAPTLSGLVAGAHRSSSANGTSGAVNGHNHEGEAGEEEDEEIEIAGVDVWVTSEYTAFFPCNNIMYS